MKRNICCYLTGLLCTAVLMVGVLPFHAYAVEENIPIDAAHFPDAAFREFITSAEFNFEEGTCTSEEGNFCIDRNQDGQLSREEREAVAYIILGKDDPMGSSGRASVDTNQYPIADLTGISYFPNLTYLQIGGRFDGEQTEYPSFLTGTVDLQDNRKLKTVILANGGVSGVDIAGHTLDTLDLHGNEGEIQDPEQGQGDAGFYSASVDQHKQVGHPIVCLDAGHYGKYNRSSVVPAYYESDMSWKLHVMLKEELEKYGIEVRTTRPNQAQDMAIVGRGLASEGCDLFVSIHSNATNSSYTDRPEAICFVPRDDSNLDELSAEIAERLGQTVYDVMGTRQRHKTYYRYGADDRDGNGKYDDNYYGVLFGAFTVGTPGLILEHSYHTNAAAATWLLQDSNLRKLAVAEAKTIADWLEEKNPRPQPEWKHNEYGWWYEYSDGTFPANQWEVIDGAWYHFDAWGYMQTGWQVVNGCWYYFAPSGYMMTGWQMINSGWYYFSPSGEMRTGWQKIKGYWYYFSPSGEMQTGWQEIHGYRYYFAPGGDMQTGWKDIDGQRYYFVAGGAMATGWQEIEGQWYYFTEQGETLTDWQEIDGKRYYFEVGGTVATGWKDIDGQRYYFADNGDMQIGWQKIGSKHYFFYDDGTMARNTWIDDKFVDESGALVEPKVETGWQSDDRGWKYNDADGNYVTGWQVINGYWYYLAPSGYMLTGWQMVNGYWYYLAPSGYMLTGWQMVNGYWYYFAPSGYMLTGWQWINGSCYYFYPSGYMAANAWIGGSYVNGSGAWVK